MINCKNCNKAFQPTFNKGSEQIYCSVKCRQENAQKRMYDKIKNQVIGQSNKIEEPIVNSNKPVINSNELIDLKIEIERMKFQQKLNEIENYYANQLNEIRNNMELIYKKYEEYDDEPNEDYSNDFYKALSGIAPLIIDKLQKNA